MATDSELDLGIMPEKTEDKCNPCCAPEQSDKPVHPELSFDGPHADLFNEKYGPFQTDDEITLTIRTRIKKFSMGPERWDKCIKLSAIAIIGDVVEEEASGEKPEKEEKPVRRMGKKAEAATY